MQPRIDAAAWDDPDEQAAFTRPIAAAPGCAESVFAVGGLRCAACAASIEQALRALPGVREAEVQYAARRARVVWERAATRASQLAAAVVAAGYRAYPGAAAEPQAQRLQRQRVALWQLFVAGFCMMQVMMYAVPVYLAAPGDMTADIARLLQWASWVLTLPVVLFSAQPFLRSAWSDLRHRRLGMDVPVALGIVVTFAASSYATFEPQGLLGHEVYFDSLTMFVFFLLAGRYLELRAQQRAALVLEELTRSVPASVLRQRPDGSYAAVPLRQLRVDDVVQVRPGEALPADGRLLDGPSQVDEALLSGEARPVPKRAGDKVLAGSFNLSAAVRLRVTALGRDTLHGQIVALMERAAAQRPALARVADRYAQYFVAAVLGVAVLAGLGWWAVDPGRALWIAVAVLVVTCPCALSLATPVTLLAATQALARRGVLVQHPDAIEKLARVDRVIFDKTGTLTEGRLRLAQITVVGGDNDAGTQAAMLAAAQALASHSLHPVARALCAATPPAVPAVAAFTQMRELPGAGIEARDAQGGCWRLGSAAFTGAYGDAAGRTFLSTPQGRLAGFRFDEALRADAAPVVRRLHEAGVKVALLSGDRPQAVQRLAAQCAIDDARAGCTPEDKLAEVRRRQQQGECVAMVGDGFNDGPSLAQADVSFAVGGAVPVAQAKADFVVLHGGLSAIADARETARRAMRIVRQNLWWAAGYNAACVPLAAIGWLPPWLAGLGMACSSLAVVLNALRLVDRTPRMPAATHGPAAAAGWSAA
jgi:Cu2+-exporting ATPase